MIEDNYGWVLEDSFDKKDSERRVEIKIYPWFIKLIRLSDKYKPFKYIVRVCISLGIGLCLKRIGKQ
jgi:hypothetical protein